MRAAEVLSLVYFLHLPVAGRLAGNPRRTPWADVVSLAIAAAAVGVSRLGGGAQASLVRDWAPGVFLLLAYWMSGPYTGAPSQELERQLLGLDRRFVRPALDRLAVRAPRLALELLEFAYLTCYPFLPAGLLCLLWTDAPVEPDRFWTAVLVAALPCYALLPWIHTRPPRTLEANLPIDRRALAARRLNLFLLWHTSVHANTFPSAHVSSTVAVALTVVAALPVAGSAFLALAALIALSTVQGRYHYGADALLGALLGVAGFLVSQGL